MKRNGAEGRNRLPHNAYLLLSEGSSLGKWAVALVVVEVSG